MNEAIRLEHDKSHRFKRRFNSKRKEILFQYYFEYVKEKEKEKEKDKWNMYILRMFQDIFRAYELCIKWNLLIRGAFCAFSFTIYSS